MDTTYETHACFSSLSNVIGNTDLDCKLRRDEIISHVVLDIDGIKACHCRVITMSGLYVINSKFQREMQSKIIDCKVKTKLSFCFFSIY